MVMCGVFIMHMRKNTTEPTPLNPVPIDPNLHNWFSGGNAGELKTMIQATTFRKAEALLKEQARPTRATLKNTEINNLNHAWFAGYCDAFRDLRKLTHAPDKTPKSFDSDGWSHIT